MSIIIQRNRILVNGFNEDKIEEFVKRSTVFQPKMTFGYDEMWTAMREVIWNDEYYVALPRNFPPEILMKFIDHDKRKIIKDPLYCIKSKKVSINLKEGITHRNEFQKEIGDFLGGRNSFSDIKKKPRRALFVDTGEGKTFMTISEICLSKTMTAIICPDDRSVNTWKEELVKFTTILPEEVFVVAGEPSYKRAIKNKDSIKILLISAKTLSSSFKSDNDSVVVNLFEELQVGLKVIDEMHLNLKTIFNLEMTVVTEKTFYLTATDSRRIKSEQIILENMTPPGDCVYRQEKVKKFEYVTVTYFTNPLKEHQKGINKPNGFDALSYLKMLFNPELPYKDWYCKEVLKKTVSYALKSLSDPKNKIAYLTKTNESGLAIGEAIANYFPNVTIGYFNSKISNMEERMKQTECNIIISTDKSFSGIINIPNLEVIINATPITSEAHLLQIMGRLRDEKNKRRIFIQLCDSSFKKARNMLYRMKSIVHPVMTEERFFSVGKASHGKVEEEDY